jgi:hypothetical protein
MTTIHLNVDVRRYRPDACRGGRPRFGVVLHQADDSHSLEALEQSLMKAYETKGAGYAMGAYERFVNPRLYSIRAFDGEQTIPLEDEDDLAWLRQNSVKGGYEIYANMMVDSVHQPQPTL